MERWPEIGPFASDLLLCAGARFDDRITGKVDKYAQEAYVIHFDVDKSEHNKNVHAHFPIRTDVKYALRRMCELIKKNGFEKPDLSPWLETIDGWKKEHPFKYTKGEHVTGQEAIEALYEESKGEAIITTGVGQHQMWAAQYYKYKEPRTYISSLGLGTMGFGYPAAVGVKVARPDKEVIDIDGDGSFLMSVQELATAKIEKINAKCLLLNNQHLGMVMQWEDRFYESVRGHTILCDPENLGGPDNLDAIYPDYVKMCEGFGVKARRGHQAPEDLRDGIREMLEADEPFLLEIIVPYSERHAHDSARQVSQGNADRIRSQSISLINLSPNRPKKLCSFLASTDVNERFLGLTRVLFLLLCASCSRRNRTIPLRVPANHPPLLPQKSKKRTGWFCSEAVVISGETTNHLGTVISILKKVRLTGLRFRAFGSTSTK